MANSPEVKLYRAGSIPLKEINTVKEGQLVYTSSGKCFACVGQSPEGSYVYEHVHDSELVEGETLESIADNDSLLTIFWKLSEKRLNKTNYAGKY